MGSTYMALIALPVVLAVLSSCDSSDGPPSCDSSGPRIVMAIEPCASPADCIALSDNDILSYEWRRHFVRLTPAGASQLARIFEKVTSVTEGIPFTMRVDGEVLYSGDFWSLFSSVTPPGIAIIVGAGAAELTIESPFARDSILSVADVPGWPERNALLRRYHEANVAGAGAISNERLRRALLELRKLR